MGTHDSALLKLSEVGEITAYVGRRGQWQPSQTALTFPHPRAEAPTLYLRGRLWTDSPIQLGSKLKSPFALHSPLHSLPFTMLGYEFVTLDNEQTANRRQLLDLYGSIGQWSVLVMLALVQLAFFIRWAIFKTAKVERPRSPHPNKVMDFGSRAWYWRLEEKLTRFRWWADERPREGWFTKGECILGLVWSMWLLFLCVHRTGNGKYQPSSTVFRFTASHLT